MQKPFKALVVEDQEGVCHATVQPIQLNDLPEGDVLINVHYSGINYKDGLAADRNGQVVKKTPFIPGIDLAGEVVESSDDRFEPGDFVVATSYEIGVSHFGGYSQFARVPADWVVPLPKGLTLKESMILGTAGFTAALSIQRLEENGLTPNDGEVLVTGATGGVGSLAVAMLARKNYAVVASTGKSADHEYLKELGATKVISREDVYDGKLSTLGKQQWAGAVDPVGGEPLASVLSQIKYRGSVAVSGLTAGGKVPTNVFPFILRGVSLLGIDSVYCPMAERIQIWERLATDLKLPQLEQHVAEEITLDQVPERLPAILKGKIRGRILIRL
ncbi:alcohol dehydrogenase [Bacillus sp. JCM 19046]|nr:alcohol dehydrogenase [Bacillus sp. JCM 19046]